MAARSSAATALDSAEQEKSKAVTILNINKDKTAATVAVHGEGHTLGNSLRHVLMQRYALAKNGSSPLCECIWIDYLRANIFDYFTTATVFFSLICFYAYGQTFALFVRVIFSKDVDFCGYSCPHPFEKKMHIRVQTTGDLPSKPFYS